VLTSGVFTNVTVRKGAFDAMFGVRREQGMMWRMYTRFGLSVSRLDFKALSPGVDALRTSALFAFLNSPNCRCLSRPTIQTSYEQSIKPSRRARS